VKPRIIKLVATKPFRGLEDDNSYRHIKEFTMICNTMQQGVPVSHPDLRANPNARIHVREDQVTHMHRLSEYQNTV
jgi:hypothetical protein